MSSANPSFLTPEEYLELERKAEIKSEYVNGRMYAMSGGSRQHVRITMNFQNELTSQLRGKPCEPYNSDMRVKVTPAGMYTYPDASVACGKPLFEDSGVDTLLNPVMIAEVLSPSTEAYDRGEKFAQYRRVHTLREYVLFSQDKIRIEHYVRERELWILSELNTPDAVLHLPAIDCHIAVAAIYANVELPDLTIVTRPT